MEEQIINNRLKVRRRSKVVASNGIVSCFYFFLASVAVLCVFTGQEFYDPVFRLCEARFN